MVAAFGIQPMTWLRTREAPLLATANAYPVEWWLLYSDTDRAHWWNRWLRPQFQHVSAIKRDGRVWIAIHPYGEFTDVEILRTDAHPWQIAPRAIVQRVTAMRRERSVRAPWFLGPITCVEHVKALLGIRAFWVRTPWQLFNYCKGAFQ
jgi:hypothetical protein